MDLTDLTLPDELDPAHELERQLAIIWCRLNTWRHPLTGADMTQTEKDWINDDSRRTDLIYHVRALSRRGVQQRLWMQGRELWTNIPVTRYKIRRADRTSIQGVKPGDIIFAGRDGFGLANEDSRHLGVEHGAYSVNPSGVPCFTMPKEDVEKIEGLESSHGPTCKCTECEAKRLRHTL